MVRHNDGRRPARAKTSPGASKPAARTNPSPNERQRIAKVMARAGLCSRREAEAWICDGRVNVNGIVLTSPATDVRREDIVLVDGTPLPAAERTRLFLFHKPRGLVTSDHDPEGRATVTGFLREHWPAGPRVVTVGRLDINTEGLLLLTNDGGLARILELPRTGWLRRYRVRAKGVTDQSVLDGLARGVSIEGVDYAGIEATLDRVQGANCWLTMGLREGKNREIKRVLEHIGLEVNRLIRLSFGPFQLRDLAEGIVEEVRARVLRDQLGESLIAAAGVDLRDDVDVVASEPATPHRAAKSGEQSRPDRPRAQSAVPRPGSNVGTRNEKRPARRGDQHESRTSKSQTDRSTPRERPVVGTRKHVSKLRTEAALGQRGGPRKRVDRTETTDRKARVIAVERIVTSPGVALEPTRSRKDEGHGQPSAKGQQRGRRSYIEAHSPPSDIGRLDKPGKWPRKGKPSSGEARRSPAATAKQVRVARSGGKPARIRGSDGRETFEDASGRDRRRRRDNNGAKGKAKGAVRRDRGGDKPGPAKPSRSRTPRDPRVPPRGAPTSTLRP